MAPEWPLADSRGGELDLWRDLWRTPQAVAWFDLGWTRTVARYARLVVQSESDTESKPTAEVALLGEIRQLEDRLGLSPLAMRRLQWEIESAPLDAVGADDNVTELFG